jgi:hypothetical protein
MVKPFAANWLRRSLLIMCMVSFENLPLNLEKVE